MFIGIEAGHSFLLGLLTLPVLGLVYVIVVTTIDSWTSRRITCGICGRGRRGWMIRQRVHSRRAHGLALTVRGRVRKRQWHGLSWTCAQQHGVTRDEYDAVREKFRETTRT